MIFNIFAFVKKNSIAILFLSILLCTNSELHQLLKIPVLISHFIEHKKEDPNISLLSFLKMHYQANPVKDKDYDRDMQLPFKADNCNFLGLAFYTHKPSFEIINREEFIEQNRFDFYTPFSSAQVLNSIWQPPRLV